MAKDVFSFYVCVRWVPDEVFWSVAMEELRSDILKTVVEHKKDAAQAISELYQTFKFIPLLCSRNLAVYAEKNTTTRTYYPQFKQKVTELSHFLTASESRPVYQGLKHVDEAFCNSDKMNSPGCDAEVAFANWANQVQQWFGQDGGFKTTKDRWAAMHEIFKSFKLRRNASEHKWDNDFLGWKAQFPYHSFIAKPGGASHQASPKSTERFLVCFGKRVASEMHRRPAGTSIITDQNAVGCHGWWDAPKVSQMLSRMVDLWKPPTCQLAEKTFEMKKQILLMYTKMNEDLYGALPSMLQDEKLFKNGALQQALAGPQPYSVEHVMLGDERYYSGMRVAKIADGQYPKAECHWYQPTAFCQITIKHGSAGTIEVKNGVARVLWDDDPEEAKRKFEAGEVQVVPQEYGQKSVGVIDKIGSALNSAGQWFDNIFKSGWGSSYSNLAELLSGSLTKWVVCGVAENASLDELDTWLGTEDEAFQEHLRQAYAKWTGYEKKVPGSECVSDPLVDQAQFPGCQVCDFSELHVDHPEKYWREDGTKEEFMCPLVPPMAPTEQLSVFLKKKSKCLLHMTREHQRQFQWHYNGHHPARKQNNRQNNVPQVEYQLVKLLEVAEAAGPQQVSFGRSCTVQERKANPRFCTAPKLQRKWPTLQEMAGSMSKWLSGALGMPVGAISNLIANYQRIMEQNATGGDMAQDAAVALSEQAWEGLMGLGRLAHSTAQSAGNQVLYKLPEEANRHVRLERELFGFQHSGDMLHGASFQAGISSSGTTSNSRDRYRRYAVVCDCEDFDPGLELALRWEWSEVALRVFKEAMRHQPTIIDQPTPFVEVRSEARLFWKQNQEHANSTHFTYGAAIHPVITKGTPQPGTVCQLDWGWFGQRCVPEDRCELEAWWSPQCRLKPSGKASSKDAWQTVWDGKLAEELGGNPLGQADHSTLRALSVRFYCGKKSDFSDTGPPSVTPASLRSCLESGYKANAALKASEPWKLYFPDEVVVVAEFGTINEQQCTSTKEDTKGLVCGTGAVEAPGLDAHLDSSVLGGGGSGGEYRGLRTGVGFPTGAVKEVVLRPEDVLAANGLLLSR